MAPFVGEGEFLPTSVVRGGSHRQPYDHQPGVGHSARLRGAAARSIDVPYLRGSGRDRARILLLLAVVAAVTLLAARIGVPYPILMVVAGLGIGLLPFMPRVELEPDVVLGLFLPPILFSAAYVLSPRDLWRNVRPISLLAVGLVFTTTLGVAAVVMALAPELGWPVAIALGAIGSPPDAMVRRFRCGAVAAPGQRRHARCRQPDSALNRAPRRPHP